MTKSQLCIRLDLANGSRIGPGLILSAERLTACPSLGLEFGISVETAAHGLTGAAIAASPDVSQALETAVRYRPLRGRAVEFEFVAGKDCLTLFIREPFDLGDIRTFILEAHVGIIERFMTAVAGEPLFGIEYQFPYPPPAMPARKSPNGACSERACPSRQSQSGLGM